MPRELKPTDVPYWSHCLDPWAAANQSRRWRRERRRGAIDAVHRMVRDLGPKGNAGGYLQHLTRDDRVRALARLAKALGLEPREVASVPVVVPALAPAPAVGVERRLLAKVPSETTAGVVYYVRREPDGTLSCTCAHWIHRRAFCKHMGCLPTARRAA